MKGSAIAFALLALAAVALAPPAGAGGAQPSHCAPKQLRGALVDFASAYSRGDYATLDSLIAAEPEFEWYSTDAPGTRIGPGSKRRSSLIPYFEARHRKHDRFRLASFGFNGNSPRYGNFEMGMRRRADGFRRGDWFRVWGKGAAICDAAEVRFIVLTFGTMPAR